MVSRSQQHSRVGWESCSAYEMKDSFSRDCLCCCKTSIHKVSKLSCLLLLTSFWRVCLSPFGAYSLLILESKHNDACNVFCFILPLERRENGTKRKICLLKSRLLAFGFSLFTLADRWFLLHFFFSLNNGFQGQSQAMCLLRSLLCHTWYYNYPILFWDSRI